MTLPCKDCLTLAICLNLFREFRRYEPGLTFDITPVDALYNRCSILISWRVNQGLTIWDKNNSNQKIYDYFINFSNDEICTKTFDYKKGLIIDYYETSIKDNYDE